MHTLHACEGPGLSAGSAHAEEAFAEACASEADANAADVLVACVQCDAAGQLGVLVGPRTRAAGPRNAAVRGDWPER